MLSVHNSEQNNTLSLDDLNPQAFALMKACGHRIVSIKKESKSKFKVNTECTNGIIRRYQDGRCEGKGFMQFRIKQTGTELYLGKFDHQEKCQQQAGEIEGIEDNRDDFKSSWQQTISEAKSSAESKLQKARDDRAAEIEWAKKNNGAYTCTPHEVYAARGLLGGVTNLESQFKEIFKD